MYEAICGGLFGVKIGIFISIMESWKTDTHEYSSGISSTIKTVFDGEEAGADWISLYCSYISGLCVVVL